MLRILSGLVKIALASLVAGVVLAYFDISPNLILRDLGVTPEKLMARLLRGLQWAIPHLIMGSLVIVPVWLIIYLFRPPRS